MKCSHSIPARRNARLGLLLVCLALLAASAMSQAAPHKPARAGSPANCAPASPQGSAAQRRLDEEIANLHAEAQQAAAEQMRRQLEQAQRNQQMQLDYITHRSEMQYKLTLVLGACLALALALAASTWAASRERKRQALEDPLTGLKNRRFLEPFLQQEAQRMLRNRHGALLMIVDLDHFKTVNDRYGHHTGDQALVKVAEVLKLSVRTSDVVARWGGEEFVILCTHSTEEHARVICERIRHRLALTGIEHPGKPEFHLSASIGVALFSPSQFDESWQQALARADRAMYHVKQSGRDGWSLDHAGQPGTAETVSPEAAAR